MSTPPEVGRQLSGGYQVRTDSIMVSRCRSAQALVATNALLLDPEARQKFADRVHHLSAGGRQAPETPKTLVLAIAGRRHLDANSLFTFGQVTLVRLEQQLNLRGIAVQVIAIP